KVPIGYRVERPPKGATSDQALLVSPKVVIKRIARVDDVNQAINMELIIIQSWIDRRIKFTHLFENRVKNKLSKDEVSNVWQPSIVFENALDGNIKLQSKMIEIEKIGFPLPPDYNDVVMDTIYNGSSGYLHKSELYTGSFSCQLDVFYYPFDIQW
ncbi:unnamed protein product, partial [Meganyctiphanes norvegica]